METYKKTNNSTYAKWRRMLLHTNIYLALFVFLVELGMVYILGRSNLILQPLPVYLFFFLILPTSLNLTVLIAGAILQKRLPENSKYLNYIPVVSQAFICLTVASTHYIFSVTLCIFLIPVFTTIIFSDKIMTKRVGRICGLFLCFALIYRRLSPFSAAKDPYFYTEAIVAIAVFLSTFLICNVLIEYQIEKDRVISSAFLKQMEMQEQLSKDQKTGLFGFTAFTNTLANLVENSAITHKPIALSILDIDDFKRINDSFGHLKGDQVIWAISGIMKRNARPGIFLARIGGEEFAIIFFGNEVFHAHEFVEMIREQFKEEEYPFTKDQITVSIGIAYWKSGMKADRLFECADAAMYKAKAQGRNQTQISEC